MLAVFCLAFAIDPPTVTVDVDALTLPQAQAEQLHGELMTRLVESGHAVGSTGTIVVRLTGGGDRVHIEVQHGTRAWTRDVRGKGALLRLAAIHATLELLAQLEVVVDPDPVRAAAIERSVVVVAEPAAEQWLPAVIEALVDAGNVVTPHAESASLRVCVDAMDGRPTLAVVESDGECPAGVASEDLASDVATTLAAARARQPAAAAESSPTADAQSAPRSKPSDQPAVAREAKSPVASPPSRWTGAIGIGVGAQGRLRAPEALVLLHGDARHRSGAMLTVRASVAPAIEDALSVADSFVTAGAGWGFRPHARLRVELLAAAGILIHGYGLSGERGARVDFTAEVPITFAVVLTSRVELGLSAIAGVSGRARRHVIDDTVVWDRSRWRIAGLASLRIVLGRKLSRTAMAGGT